MHIRYDYKNLTLVLIWIILVFSKIFQFSFLPAKYFYDSNRIIGYTRYIPNYLDDGAYRFTALLFKKINVFGFTTITEWAIAITCIFSVSIFCIIYKRTREVDIIKFIFICCSIFLMGVYVFNISKDIIQLVIFLAVYLIIITKKINSIYTKILYINGCV